MKSFYELALTGSAVKAAARLNVSSSSISHQVKSLEAELGVRLVENRKGKLHLTVDGSQFFERIRGPMAEILAATETIRSMPGRKRVSLTLTPSFAAGWLMPRMTDLERSHPDLEVNLIATTRVVDLARENIDLAIRRGTGPWPGYVAAALQAEIVVPVMSPELAREMDTTSVDTMLAGARLLVNTTVEGEWDQWCAARGFGMPQSVRRYNLETYELTIQAAREGLGIALGRRPLVDPVLTSGALVAPLSVPQPDSMAYYLLRRAQPMSSDVKRLHDWLAGQAG